MNLQSSKFQCYLQGKVHSVWAGFRNCFTNIKYRWHVEKVTKVNEWESYRTISNLFVSYKLNINCVLIYKHDCQIKSYLVGMTNRLPANDLRHGFQLGIQNLICEMIGGS